MSDVSRPASTEVAGLSEVRRQELVDEIGIAATEVLWRPDKLRIEDSQCFYGFRGLIETMLVVEPLDEEALCSGGTATAKRRHTGFADHGEILARITYRPDSGIDSREGVVIRINGPVIQRRDRRRFELLNALEYDMAADLASPRPTTSSRIRHRADYTLIGHRSTRVDDILLETARRARTAPALAEQIQPEDYRFVDMGEILRGTSEFEIVQRNERS